jgi:hypothetical protein
MLLTGYWTQVLKLPICGSVAEEVFPGDVLRSIHWALQEYQKETKSNAEMLL